MRVSHCKEDILFPFSFSLSLSLSLYNHSHMRQVLVLLDLVEVESEELAELSELGSPLVLGAEAERLPRDAVVELLDLNDIRHSLTLL